MFIMTAVSSSSSSESITLTPSYAIPLFLVGVSIPVILLQRWVGLGLSLFGLFLLFQTATLRLQFTTTDLDVYRGELLIRRFPYQHWQTWRIFWPSFPILFYFREIKSIHFLPVLFDPKVLRSALEAKLPGLDQTIAP